MAGWALFGAKDPATGFSFVVFFLLTAPLWILGLLALGRTGMTSASFRSQVRMLARYRHAGGRRQSVAPARHLSVARRTPVLS